MPTPDQILKGLEQIANDWSFLATLWHIYFAVLVVLMIGGIKPTRRTAGMVLSIPLLSAGILALVSRNPFNGTLLTLLSIALIVISRGLPGEATAVSHGWRLAAGIAMFAFGWLYPHFLRTSSFIPYLYSAPTGIVPCPTLSIVIGSLLIANGLGSRAWSLVIGAAGIFYGLFGAARLGVYIDVALFLGALLIVLNTLGGKAARHQSEYVREDAGLS